MTTHERMFINPGVSHAMNAMSGAVGECGAYPTFYGPKSKDWRGWDEDIPEDIRINNENRQCKTCVRLVGSDW